MQKVSNVVLDKCSVKPAVSYVTSNYGKETSVSCPLKVFQSCHFLSKETKMATTVQSGGICGALNIGHYSSSKVLLGFLFVSYLIIL
jgi:hypothetical protein